MTTENSGGSVPASTDRIQEARLALLTRIGEVAGLPPDYAEGVDPHSETAKCIDALIARVRESVEEEQRIRNGGKGANT